MVATDGQLRAVELAAHNLHANTKPLVPAGKNGEQLLLSRYRAEQLRWGNQDDIERVRALSPDGGGYDLIIGSDLIYFGAHTQAIAPTAQPQYTLTNTLVVSVLSGCTIGSG